MTKPNSWMFGVIEGFYGQPWSAESRLASAEFCASLGMTSYVYAPKADPYLRKAWDKPWPGQEQQQLIALAAGVKSRGLEFGIGFSPYDISGRFDKKTRQQLALRLAEIDACKPDVLCILFDDMPGDQAGLATGQLQVVDFVAARTSASALAVCPTYYSFDPVLEKVFGTRPANYWSELGGGLDASIDLIWTGDKVCSVDYPSRSIESISSILLRKPLIWDNYPVNDSARASRFLHLQPASRPVDLQSYTRGLLINPMNQCWLSRPALAGVGVGAKRSLEELLCRVYPQDLADLLRRDWSSFQQLGLDGIPAETKRELASQYAKIDHPAAVEVCGWLSEQYRFDPDCLTD